MDTMALFVDDDQRFIAGYVKAVRARGMSAYYAPGVDEALSYLRGGGQADVIVWDLMMVPGQEFADEDTEDGFATGRFLYRTMRKLRPDAAFVLLAHMVPSSEEADQPEQRSVVCLKANNPPDVLAKLIANLVESGKSRTVREVE